MSGHERGCKMAGCGSVTTCPVCGGKIVPRRPSRLSDTAIERALQVRPRSGAFEPDPDDDLGASLRRAS